MTFDVIQLHCFVDCRCRAPSARPHVTFTRQAYEVHGFGAPAFSLHYSIELTMGGTHYKVKVGSRLKIGTGLGSDPLRAILTRTCIGIYFVSFAYPSFTIRRHSANELNVVQLQANMPQPGYQDGGSNFSTRSFAERTHALWDSETAPPDPLSHSFMKSPGASLGGRVST